MDSDNLPKHIAIIMDGNGRWAKSRHLSRTEGHVAGVKRAEEVVFTANKLGIKAVTLFTFSTENWNRPEAEVTVLMNMVASALIKKVDHLNKNNIKFQMIGRKDRLPKVVLQAIEQAMAQTKNNTGLTVNLAFNYGSRVEIIDAVREIAEAVKQGTLNAPEISEQLFSQYLYTRDLPDPDLLIRTSGEKRISNFLLWQLSYAEFYFTDALWPDFDETEFKRALADFQNRDRRFGGVTGDEHR